MATMAAGSTSPAAMAAAGARCPAGRRSPVAQHARAASSRGLPSCDGIRHRLIARRRLGHVLTGNSRFSSPRHQCSPPGRLLVKSGLRLSEHLANLKGIRSCGGFHRRRAFARRPDRDPDQELPDDRHRHRRTRPHDHGDLASAVSRHSSSGAQDARSMARLGSAARISSMSLFAGAVTGMPVKRCSARGLTQRTRPIGRARRLKSIGGAADDAHAALHRRRCRAAPSACAAAAAAERPGQAPGLVPLPGTRPRLKFTVPGA